MREREKRPDPNRQYFVLSTRDPLFPPRLPPFIEQEGSRLALTSYLSNPTTSDLPMYLIPYYLHQRSRTREGPVHTRLCTDCAWGRFSSRQRGARARSLQELTHHYVRVST